MLLETRERLRRIYASGVAPAEMRARKDQEFGRLKFEYTLLRAGWNGYSGYDRWFDRALSNADLVSAATYHGCLPGLLQLLNSVNGELPRFYEEVRKLTQLTKAERSRQLCEAAPQPPPVSGGG